MPVANLAALAAAGAQAGAGCCAVLRGAELAGDGTAQALATQALNILCGPDSGLPVAELCVCSSDTQKLICPGDQAFLTALGREGSSWGSKAPDGAEEIPGSPQVLLPLLKPQSAPGQQSMKAVTLGLQGPLPSR